MKYILEGIWGYYYYFYFLSVYVCVCDHKIDEEEERKVTSANLFKTNPLKFSSFYFYSAGYIYFLR